MPACIPEPAKVSPLICDEIDTVVARKHLAQENLDAVLEGLVDLLKNTKNKLGIQLNSFF